MINIFFSLIKGKKSRKTNQKQNCENTLARVCLWFKRSSANCKAKSSICSHKWSICAWIGGGRFEPLQRLTIQIKNETCFVCYRESSSIFVCSSFKWKRSSFIIASTFGLFFLIVKPCWLKTCRFSPCKKNKFSTKITSNSR